MNDAGYLNINFGLDSAKPSLLNLQRHPAGKRDCVDIYLTAMRVIQWRIPVFRRQAIRIVQVARGDVKGTSNIAQQRSVVETNVQHLCTTQHKGVDIVRGKDHKLRGN